MRRRIEWRPWASEVDDGPRTGNEVTPPPRPVSATPAGFVPDALARAVVTPDRLWAMHTTFVVDSDRDLGGVTEAVLAVPGVETFDPVSPYQACLGVGLAFDADDVRRWVEEALAADVLVMDARTAVNVGDLTAVLSKRHSHWAVLVLPNGAIESAHAETAGALAPTLSVYRATRELVGGIIRTG